MKTIQPAENHNVLGRQCNRAADSDELLTIINSSHRILLLVQAQHVIHSESCEGFSACSVLVVAVGIPGNELEETSSRWVSTTLEPTVLVLNQPAEGNADTRKRLCDLSIYL